MAKKQAKPEEPAGESAPMWIVSFADLVTLMMSFFVVLFALKQGGASQQAQTAAAIANTFGAEADPYADDLTNQWLKYYQHKGKMPVSKEMGNADFSAKGAEGKNPEVTTIRPGKDITSGGAITFEPGSVVLDEAAQKTIGKLADVLRGHNNVLMLKGHASPDELTYHPEDLNGMSLSNQRAGVVAEALVKVGLDRRALRPVACGIFEPVKAQVYDVAGQRQNRRVEVYSTDTIVSEYQPNTTVKPTGEVAGSTEEAGSPEKIAVHKGEETGAVEPGKAPVGAGKNGHE